MEAPPWRDEVLEKHALFASMERWEWLQVCRALEEVHVRKHDMICKEGEQGPEQDFFYIIEKGSVEVFVMKDVPLPPPPKLTAEEIEKKEREEQRKANLKALGLKDDVKVDKKKDTENLIREEFRKQSYFSDIAVGVISGLGPVGYELALQAAVNYLQERI